MVYLFTSYYRRRPAPIDNKNLKDQRTRSAPRSRILALPETNEQTIRAQQEDLDMDYSSNDFKAIPEYRKNK
jgi:hypothetical protein